MRGARDDEPDFGGMSETERYYYYKRNYEFKKAEVERLEHALRDTQRMLTGYRRVVCLRRDRPPKDYTFWVN